MMKFLSADGHDRCAEILFINHICHAQSRNIQNPNSIKKSMVRCVANGEPEEAIPRIRHYAPSMSFPVDGSSHIFIPHALATLYA